MIASHRPSILPIEKIRWPRGNYWTFAVIYYWIRHLTPREYFPPDLLSGVTITLFVFSFLFFLEKSNTMIPTIVGLFCFFLSLLFLCHMRIYIHIFFSLLSLCSHFLIWKQSFLLPMCDKQIKQNRFLYRFLACICLFVFIFVFEKKSIRMSNLFHWAQTINVSEFHANRALRIDHVDSQVFSGTFPRDLTKWAPVL